MAGLWSVFVPEAGQNLITNPSLELNATGWTVFGAGSIARSAAFQFKGSYALAVTPTATTTDGCYFGTVSLVSGTTYTFTVWVKGVNAIPYRIYFASTAPAVLGTPTTFTGTGNWQQVTVTYAEVSTTTRRLYVVKNGSADTGVFYVDAAQCEAKSYNTRYMDGEQEGCFWDGTAHGSTSTRDSQSRAGGREFNFDAYNFFVNGQQGTGMPPLRNVITPYGLRDGGLYQRTIALPRTLTLTGDIIGNSLANLLASRSGLIDALKPDLVSPQQPFILKYSGNTRPALINAVYDDGLQLNKQDSGFTEVGVNVRMIAPDPVWFEEGEGGAAPSVQTSVSNANFILQRNATGVWSALSTGMNVGIECLALTPDGGILAGGAFSTPFNGFAKWLNGAWVNVGSASSMNITYALAVDAAGNIYAGGDFINANGDANQDGINKWNGSAWSALGTGAVGAVYALAIAPDGSVYAGGTFASMGGVANTLRMAKWNGSAWSALSTGRDNDVNALVVAGDGTLYAGGNFTGKISSWNGSAWTTLGSLTSNVWTLQFDRAGNLLAGTEAGLYSWNGSAWITLATSNAAVRALGILNSGVIVVGGSFSVIGGITVPDGLALWNGSSILFPDVDLPSTTPAINGIVYVNSVLTIGWGVNSGTAVAGATTTITNNGKAVAYPKIIFTAPSSGSATVYGITNFTTGEALYFKLTLAASESAILDLTPGARRFTSNFRGDISGTILSGSNDDTFHLAPGANSLGVFISNSSATCALWWRVRHVSIDGAN